MRPDVLPFLLGASGLLLLGGIALAIVSRRDARLDERLLGVRRAAGAAPGGAGLRGRALGLLAAVGNRLIRGGVLSAKTVAGLEQTLASAGFRGDRALGVFIGAKVTALLGLPAAAYGALLLLGSLEDWGTYVIPAACILGLLAPDAVAKRLRRRYVASVERSLPDALDLMVICAEAGLALEGTMERVATEIRVASPAIAAELALCNSEMRILPDRRVALMNMADRTGLESLRRLAVTLSQSVRFGTPLIQALRTLSAEMRTEAMTRFEARAARLPVLLTVPMIAFILPVLLIVAAGPAAIDLMRAQ